MKEYVFTLYGRRHAARQKKRRKADTSSLFTNGDAVHTPRRKTPEGKPFPSLYNTDAVHTPRRKTPEGNPLSALYNTDTVHAPRRKTPEGKPLSALYSTDTVHAPRRKTPEGKPLYFTTPTPFTYRGGKRLTADTTPLFASITPIQQKKRRMTACPPLPPLKRTYTAP